MLAVDFKLLIPSCAWLFHFSIPAVVVVAVQNKNETQNDIMAASKPVFRNAEEGEKLVSATTKFAFSLYQQLVSESEGNLFLSPASIAIALGMTYLGARQNTASEMKEVLHFKDVADEHLHPSFGDMLTALQSTDGKYALHTANRLYCEQSFKLLDEFASVTKSHYKAEMAAVDFKRNHEGVRREINQWVEEQTRQKIQDLLAEGVLNPLVRLVLVNAVYFKGDWSSKFKESATKDGDFHVSSGRTVQVPLMYQKADFNIGYNKDLESYILELPYVDNKLSMFVILPKSLDGLEQLQKRLKSQHLLNPEREFVMRAKKVQVTLPRFKLEQSFSLGDSLSAMGMRDMFDITKADFSGIDGAGQLFVSKVVHKAFIEVNEEGSEAAAATAVVMMLRSMPAPDPEFKADHPFLFFIRENTTKAILFFGKLAEPPNAKGGGGMAQQEAKLEL